MASLSRTSLLPALVSLLALACINPGKTDSSSSDEGSGDGGEGGEGGEDGGSGGTTIYDIQQGNVELESVVTLSRVIVSSPLNADGEGFFVMEPEGGEYSGVYVFLQGGTGDLFLAVGDEISLTATVTEFYDYTELVVDNPTNIEVTGTGEATPTAVSGDISDWEPYEGVLVSFSDVEVEDCVNSYGEVTLSSGIKMDDGFFQFEAGRGDTFDSITGLVVYNFEEFKVQPRTEADLAGLTEGPGCVVTCEQIQTEAIEGGVELEGVVVTSGLTRDGGFFIQDAGGGEYSGLYVFTYEDVGVDVSVGEVIDIKGSVTEYYDFTELTLSSAEDLVKTGDVVEPTATALSSAPTDWEPYESVLVTAAGIGITSDPNEYGECTTDWGITVDDWFFEHALTGDQVIDGLTGLVAYGFETWKLDPRDANDLGTGSSGGTDGGGTDGGGDGGGGTTTTLADIQSGSVTGAVTVEGLVVTAVSKNGQTFFAQDPSLSTYGGITVFVGGSGAGVAVGDVVTVSGDAMEYYDLTEIDSAPESVVITSEGTGSIAPIVLAEAPADWEPYESMLVTLSWSTTLASDADSYGECDLDGGIAIDDLCYEWDSSYGAGDSFSSITGAVYYAFGEFKIEPRSAADLPM